MNKISLLTILASIVSGCGGGGNNTQTTSPLIGVWATQACTQLTDSDGMPVNIWVKGNYEFKSDGNIIFEPKGYTDSNCTTATANFISGSLAVVTFQDQGSTTLQEGISGYKLYINYTHPLGDADANGFYTINNDSLCFSQSFVLEPNNFGIALPEISDIDFNKCLVEI